MKFKIRYEGDFITEQKSGNTYLLEFGTLAFLRLLSATSKNLIGFDPNKFNLSYAIDDKFRYTVEITRKNIFKRMLYSVIQDKEVIRLTNCIGITSGRRIGLLQLCCMRNYEEISESEVDYEKCDNNQWTLNTGLQVPADVYDVFHDPDIQEYVNKFFTILKKNFVNHTLFQDRKNRHLLLLEDYDV